MKNRALDEDRQIFQQQNAVEELTKKNEEWKSMTEREFEEAAEKEEWKSKAKSEEAE